MKYSKNDMIEIYFDNNGEKMSQRLLVLDGGYVLNKNAYCDKGDREVGYSVLNANGEKRFISIFETDVLHFDIVRHIDGINNAFVRRT